MYFTPVVSAVLLSLLKVSTGMLLFNPVNLTVDDSKGSTDFTIALSAPPANNAPVYVYMDSANQLHMNPCRLMFTPYNYYIPQNVSVLGIPAVIAYEPAFELPLKTWSPSPSYYSRNSSPSSSNVFPINNILNYNPNSGNPSSNNGYTYGIPNGDANPVRGFGILNYIPNNEGSNQNSFGNNPDSGERPNGNFPFSNLGSHYNPIAYPYENPNTTSKSNTPSGYYPHQPYGNGAPNGPSSYPYGQNTYPAGNNGYPNDYPNTPSPGGNSNGQPFYSTDPNGQYPMGSNGNDQPIFPSSPNTQYPFGNEIGYPNNPYGANGNPNSYSNYPGQNNYPFGNTRNPTDTSGYPTHNLGNPNSYPNINQYYPNSPVGNEIPNGQPGYPYDQGNNGIPNGNNGPNNNGNPNDQPGYPFDPRSNGNPNGNNGPNYPPNYNSNPNPYNPNPNQNGENAPYVPNGNPLNNYPNGPNGYPNGQAGYPNGNPEGTQPYDYHNQNWKYPANRLAGPAMTSFVYGDPHLSTFDGGQYGTANTGTYYYVLSVDGRVAIQAHEFYCGAGTVLTCIDSVAIKYGNLVTVISTTDASNKLNMTSNYDPTQFNVKMVMNSAASIYSMEFPDGTNIKLTHVTESHSFIDLDIKLSSVYRYRVKGLLGTFDNDTNPNTQLTFNGTQVNIATPSGLQEFAASYLVPKYLVLTTTSHVPQPSESEYPFLDGYALNGPAHMCRIPTNQQFVAEPLPSGIQNMCSYCNEAMPLNVGAHARMPYNEHYYPSPISSENLNQPNAASQKIAMQICQNIANNQQCNQYLNASIYISNCYSDVMSMGTLKPADSARNAYARQCNTLLQGIAIQQGTIHPTQAVTSGTCNPQDPHACSGNGLCSASGCKCFGSFTGSTCAINNAVFQSNPSQILKQMQRFSNSLSQSINGEATQTFQNVNSQFRGYQN